MKLHKRNRLKLLGKHAVVVHGLVWVLCGYNEALALNNLKIIPYVNLEGIYSDNINLGTGISGLPRDQRKAAFAVDLSPGANIIWQSGKSNLNLRYNLQNLYNANGGDGIDTFHQLQMGGHNILVQNRFYIDSQASISQQNLSNSQFNTDNFAGERTTISSFGVAPTWLPRFGNYAYGSVRVNANVFKSDKFKSNFVTNPISDSLTVSEQVNLNSGTKFKRVGWNINFSNQETFRDSGGNIQFQTGSATLRSYLDRKFSLFATLGYSNNSFVGNDQNSENGFFYTFGARWIPSKHYWVEAGGGNNSYLTVSISPMQRLSWLTTVRHNKIGLNNGTTWQTALQYRTRRSTWSLTHNNDTSTAQDIFNRLTGFETNISLDDPTTPTNEGLTPIISTTLQNSVLTRETWNLTAAYNTGRSSFGINAFYQDRNYHEVQSETQATGTTPGTAKTETTTTGEIVRGVGGWLNWQFAPKTSLYLRPQWQQIIRDDRLNAQNEKVDDQDDRFSFSVGLTHLITKQLNGRIEFRHVNQDSDVPMNNYQENRATANLFMRF